MSARAFPGCSVEGCERRSRSRTAGLCEMHYYRRRRTGTRMDGTVERVA